MSHIICIYETRIVDIEVGEPYIYKESCPISDDGIDYSQELASLYWEFIFFLLYFANDYHVPILSANTRTKERKLVNDIPLTYCSIHMRYGRLILKMKYAAYKTFNTKYRSKKMSSNFLIPRSPKPTGKVA